HFGKYILIASKEKFPPLNSLSKVEKYTNPKWDAPLMLVIDYAIFLSSQLLFCTKAITLLHKNINCHISISKKMKLLA
ncbi:MAG: hypothetical protein AAGK10_21465, partial [Cyanobacteria bacterium J06555_3]